MIRQPLVIISPHSRQRLRLRGNGCSIADVRERVVRACQCPEAAFGKRLALVGDDVVPIIEVKQHSYGTKAVVVTILAPEQALRPDTVRVEV